jgi:NitT/TauT family transport system substrate-binding protein
VISWVVLLQATLTIATAGPATAPEYLPLWVAQGEGYFAQEHIAVSLLPMRSETAAAETLARGRADMAATSLDAAMVFGATGGKPPRLVFGLTATPAVALLVPTVRKGAIRGLGDLVGSTLGVPAPGTPAELMLLALLARAEVPVPKVTIKSFGERSLAGAIESGEISAGMLPDPYATHLIEEGKAFALVDLRQRGARERWLGSPGVHSALFVQAESRLDSAHLTPLCRALLRALGRIETAPPEDIQAKLPAPVVGFPPEDFAVRLLGARGTFLRDGLVTRAMIESSLSVVRSRGPIPARVKVPGNLGRLLLTEPLKEALEPAPR